MRALHQILGTSKTSTRLIKWERSSVPNPWPCALAMVASFRN